MFFLLKISENLLLFQKIKFQKIIMVYSYVSLKYLKTMILMDIYIFLLLLYMNDLNKFVAPSSYASNSSQTPPPTGSSANSSAHSLIRDYWYELKFSDLFKFINPDGRYQCPRFNCLKSYKDASSLQRHIRWVAALSFFFFFFFNYLLNILNIVCLITIDMYVPCVLFSLRYECGGQKKFRCLMCGKAFSQSSHLKRHLESGVCVKYYLWDNVFFKIK